MQTSTTSFLLTSIKSLSQNDFNSLVEIIQREYFHVSEFINTDGTNDGGKDFRIYISNLEVKKYCQITVRQDSEKKIKSDFEKVAENIVRFGYSDVYEYYISQPISEKKQDELKSIARNEYSLDLRIFDANTISQLSCTGIEEFIFSLYPDKDLLKNSSVDKTTKLLYDLLAVGKNSSEIKTNIIHSLIIIYIREAGELSVNDLKIKISKKLNCDIQIESLKKEINALKSQKRLMSSSSNKEVLLLTDQELELVTRSIRNSEAQETHFRTHLSEILAKHCNGSIEINDIINHLLKLYSNSFKVDIEEASQNLDTDNKIQYIYKDFLSFLSKKITDPIACREIIEDIKSLCSNNDFIHRISFSTVFTGLYNSRKLKAYLDKNYKSVFIDTPIIVYLLCLKYLTNGELITDNVFFNAVKCLINFNEKQEKLKLYTTYNYIQEASGELNKALKYGQYINCDFFTDLGETRNTFINFYQMLKKQDLFDNSEGDIETFDDFAFSLGFNNTDPYHYSYQNDTNSNMRVLLEYYGVTIIDSPYYEDFEEVKKIYEITLPETKKTPSAIINDVFAIRYLLDETKHYDKNDVYQEPILLTWDSSFYTIRNKMITSNSKYKFFYIYNPAQLVGKLSMENFKLDASTITGDILAYADAMYGLTAKVKTLIEIISPFIGQKNDTNSRLFRMIAKIRKEELEEYNSHEQSDNKNLPIEEVMIRVIDHFKSSKNKMDDFIKLVDDKYKTEQIISIIKSGIIEYVKTSTITNKIYSQFDELIKK